MYSMVTDDSQELPIASVFLQFPVDPPRKRKWVEAVRREVTWIPTKHHRICSIHFQPERYNTNSSKQRKLHKDSIPTLNLPQFSHETKYDIDITDDELNETPTAIEGTHNKTSLPVNEPGLPCDPDQSHIIDTSRTLRLKQKLREKKTNN
ncbi:unnamed protein product [Leptidea sinapis]|uniref:THAP-type domain-containing protein n=1 Tax=Leptidea sinapis TaxID=189913 RepID=A0A5E4PWV8_9NEOP|nr:unnamed protein product [Leptidea sinapis]